MVDIQLIFYLDIKVEISLVLRWKKETLYSGLPGGVTPLMKLSMLRELRDLNSVVIIRELSPNTSSVSLTVRILFSEIIL